jgi:hypothetical protein
MGVPVIGPETRVSVGGPYTPALVMGLVSMLVRMLVMAMCVGVFVRVHEIPVTAPVRAGVGAGHGMSVRFVRSHSIKLIVGFPIGTSAVSGCLSTQPTPPRLDFQRTFAGVARPAPLDRAGQCEPARPV